MNYFTLNIPDTLNVNEDVFVTRRNSLNSKLNANKALELKIPKLYAMYDSDLLWSENSCVNNCWPKDNSETYIDKTMTKEHTFSDTSKRNDHGKHPRLNVIHSIDGIA